MEALVAARSQMPLVDRLARLGQMGIGGSKVRRLWVKAVAASDRGAVEREPGGYSRLGIRLGKSGVIRG
ncbi:unnamed protein product [Sphenostylis stenocarpa]|uniref:Uncharacterized protein n=1 Tax=Sphenostylis stenocarpa TaxID=92480 RepID=A0AA86SSB1_9FABA|nr:unnamed protein product [Sphenostylis stenocarpa]